MRKNVPLSGFGCRAVLFLVWVTLIPGCQSGTGEDPATGIDIRGRILDRREGPLSGMVVKLLHLGLQDSTDAQGRFRIAAPASTFPGPQGPDTLAFVQDGITVASRPVDAWVQTLPDLSLIRRSIKGQLAPPPAEIGKAEAVLTGTGLPTGGVAAELFYNQPAGEITGHLTTLDGGKETGFTVLLKVYDLQGFLVGVSQAVPFNGLAGDLTVPAFDPSGAALQVVLEAAATVAPGDTLRLSGTGSRVPPGGSIVEYSWKTDRDPEFQVAPAGEAQMPVPQPYDTSLEITFRVRDDAGASSQVTRTVRVLSRVEAFARGGWEAAFGTEHELARLIPFLSGFKGEMLVWGGFRSAPSVHGYRHDLWATRDGKDFRKVSDSVPYRVEIPDRFGPIIEFASPVVFQDSLWFIAGHPLESRVQVSGDAVQWSQVAQGETFPPRGHTNALAFKGRIWVFGGGASLGNRNTLHDVWSSADGRNWRREADGFDGADAMAVHGDTLWKTLGTRIESSTDGLNWNLQADVAGESSSIRLTLTVIDGQVVAFSDRSRAWYFDADRGSIRTVPFPSPPIGGTALFFRGRLYVLGQAGLRVL